VFFWYGGGGGGAAGWRGIGGGGWVLTKKSKGTETVINSVTPHMVGTKWDCALRIASRWSGGGGEGGVGGGGGGAGCSGVNRARSK